MSIKVNYNEKYLPAEEVSITGYLRETEFFNQENAGNLKSGRKMSEELDGVFREVIKK